jgi:uncharacterized protein
MAVTTNLSDPLSDEELERLQTILLDRVDEEAVTDSKDEGVLDVSELDGFLTATVSGPVTIVPSRWLPAVWGDFEPTWHGMGDYTAVMSMLMRHMNGIAETLIAEAGAFEPMYLEHVWKGKPVVVVDEWCEGYMRGVRLAADEWGAGASEIADLLAPIRAFTEETNWQAHEIDDLEQVQKLRDAIAPNVRAIHAYWLARRAQDGPSAKPFRRSTERIGRNNPCSCGSGKKYKNCCLQ